MKVVVVPYDSSWQDLYQSEKRCILDVLGEEVANIHHIGSTSVEGLVAKPIIDILLEVGSLDALDAAAGRLEALGYEGLGELGIERRRYFRKGGDDRTHQIHAFPAGDSHVIRHLAFRDYLRTHPEVRQKYAALKIAVAARCGNDIYKYMEGKDAFIQEQEAKALAWREDA